MPFLLVLTTVPTQKEARQLADLLLTQRLAACVQISSALESHYRWKGKKEKSREFQLWIKTKTSLYPKLEKAILKAHSYEVPEVIAISIQKGSPNYLKWLAHETGF